MALASVPHAPGRAPVLVASESAARAVSEAVAACRAGKRVSVLLHADELIDALAPIAEARHLPRAPLVVHVLAHAHAPDAAGSVRPRRARPGARHRRGPRRFFERAGGGGSSGSPCGGPPRTAKRRSFTSSTRPPALPRSTRGACARGSDLGGWPARPSGRFDRARRVRAGRHARHGQARRAFVRRARAFPAERDARAGRLHGAAASPINRAHAADAEDIVVAVRRCHSRHSRGGSRLAARGTPRRVVGVRSLRPFFAAELVKAVARAHAIIVLEPLDIALAPAGPVATALKAAFADALTWTPGFPGVGEIPPIISATVATLEAPIGPDEVHAALAEIEDGEQAQHVIVFGTLSDETRPRPPSMRPPSIRPGST